MRPFHGIEPPQLRRLFRRFSGTKRTLDEFPNCLIGVQPVTGGGAVGPQQAQAVAMMQRTHSNPGKLSELEDMVGLAQKEFPSRIEGQP